jgi:hypothetical protein
MFNIAWELKFEDLFLRFGLCTDAKNVCIMATYDKNFKLLNCYNFDFSLSYLIQEQITSV